MCQSSGSFDRNGSTRYFLSNFQMRHFSVHKSKSLVSRSLLGNVRVTSLIMGSACQFACTNEVSLYDKLNKKILFLGKSGLINLFSLKQNYIPTLTPVVNTHFFFIFNLKPRKFLFCDTTGVKVYFWSFIQNSRTTEILIKI